MNKRISTHPVETIFPFGLLLFLFLLSPSRPPNAGQAKISAAENLPAKVVRDNGKVNSPGMEPTLPWNTFLGGVDNDYGHAITHDERGNIYIVGQSYDTWGSPLRTYTGGHDAFIARLDENGILLWNTFLGGTSDDSANAVAVDENGNVYVTGQSNSTWGSPIRAYSTGTEAFVAMLDESGNLLWNTFLGGEYSDDGNGIEQDGIGNLYVSGFSDSTWGTPIQAHLGLDESFVAKLDDSGNLLWNTFLREGSSYAIAVGGSSEVYVTGDSNKYIYTAKLNDSGVLQWDTLLGSGSVLDTGEDISIDANKNIYITGYSFYTWGNPIRPYSSTSVYYCDVFVARLDDNGKLQWNTFLGGIYSDYGNGISVDNSGYVTVVGEGSAWGAPVQIGSGSFISRLDGNGILRWNYFLGSPDLDKIRDIAQDTLGNLYVTGTSNSTWGTPIRGYTSGDDVVVARFYRGSTFLPRVIKSPTR